MDYKPSQKKGHNQEEKKFGQPYNQPYPQKKYVKKA
jgi:hypothetical protein